jgi:hypothetical protein
MMLRDLVDLLYLYFRERCARNYNNVPKHATFCVFIPLCSYYIKTPESWSSGNGLLPSPQRYIALHLITQTLSIRLVVFVAVYSTGSSLL